MSVSLSTALYEKTFQHYIDNDKLTGWITKIDKDLKFIQEIIVFFNNISDEGYEKSLKYLRDLSYSDKIKVFKSSDFNQRIIDQFNLSVDYPSKKDYYYSVANFAQLIETNCEYVMYICEDISILNDCTDFISKSMDILNTADDCIATTLNACQVGYGEGWGDLKSGFSHDGITLEHDTDCSEFEEIRLRKYWNPNIKSAENFWISEGFGDHIYFSSKKKLMDVDYNTSHPIPDSRFPHYSGESFDKRLNKFMWNNKMYRYISKKLYYSHIGWPLYLKDI